MKSDSHFLSQPDSSLLARMNDVEKRWGLPTPIQAAAACGPCLTFDQARSCGHARSANHDHNTSRLSSHDHGVFLPAPEYLMSLNGKAIR